MKKKIVRILVVLAVLVVGLLVVVYCSLNSVVKKGVETVGPLATKAPVNLSGVSLSPFSGKGVLKGLVIGNPAGFKSESAIRVGSASLVVEPSSLLADKIIVRSVRVEGPEITFEGGLSGSNLSAILANIEAFAALDKAATKDKKPKKLQVDEFIITGGKINLSLTLLGGKSATVPLPDIHLTGLGQSAEGITPAEAASLVFKAVFDKTITAVTGAAGGLGKGVTDGASKALKGLGDLFKK